MAPLTQATALKTAPTILAFPPSNMSLLTLTRDRYVARLARNREEVVAAQRLRFSVINVELRVGLARSFANGRDEDQFDGQSEHFILFDRFLQQVVGTCRLQTYEPRHLCFGFYSSTKFDLSGLPDDVLKSAVEFGRVCIAKAHRNKNCLILMRQFLKEYFRRQKKRYVFGCCSLPTQDPLAGGQVFEWLQHSGHTHPKFHVMPRPGSKCIFYRNSQKLDYRNCSAPFRTYLRLGAKICGMPALDREFKTVDFFAILDLNEEKASDNASSLLGTGGNTTG